MALFRASEFASGTRILFQQSAAPTGWTKDTTHHDKSLRVVNGAVGSGGSVSFSSFAAQGIGATTLSESQIPAHQHLMAPTQGTGGLNLGDYTAVGLANATGGDRWTRGAGGNGSHTHSLNMSLQYVDTIIAVKN